MRRIMIAVLRRIFHSGISLLLVFLACCVFMGICNPEFIREFLIGILSFIALPIAFGVLGYFILNWYRDNHGQTPIRIDLNPFWNTILHNSIAMFALLAILMVLVVFLRPEIGIEAKKTLGMIYQGVIIPLLMLAIFMGIGYFFFRILTRANGRGHGHR